MQNQQTPGSKNQNKPSGVDSESRAKQQQTDPQITELRGFVDPSEDLEPTLEDGTKAPEKEQPADDKL